MFYKFYFLFFLFLFNFSLIAENHSTEEKQEIAEQMVEINGFLPSILDFSRNSNILGHHMQFSFGRKGKEHFVKTFGNEELYLDVFHNDKEITKQQAIDLLSTYFWFNQRYNTAKSKIEGWEYLPFYLKLAIINCSFFNNTIIITEFSVAGNIVYWSKISEDIFKMRQRVIKAYVENLPKNSFYNEQTDEGKKWIKENIQRQIRSLKMLKNACEKYEKELIERSLS